MLLGIQYHTLCCLAFSTIRYVAWQSAQYIMLLAVSTTHYAAWQSAPTDLLFAQYTVQTVAVFQAASLAVLIRYSSVL